MVVLAIYDGWGMDKEGEHNAIHRAETPVFDRLWNEYPHTLLEASGEAVGLPKGVMGNSEVGHLTIGTGRPADAALVQISETIANNRLGELEAVQHLLKHVIDNKGKLHLIGLLSDGGVHSHQEHLFALTKFAKDQGVSRIAIHAITDGRDTPPTSGSGYLETLEKETEALSGVNIPTVVGRYYAMDRDKRMERTEFAIKAIFDGEGENCGQEKPSEVLKAKYTQDGDDKVESDELVKPLVFTDSEGNKTLVEDGDGILFFNFRPDRAIQLSQRIVGRIEGRNISFVTMMSYDESIQVPSAFVPEKRPYSLAHTIAKAGLKQLHVAETEKFAHVTYFLNGGVKEEVPGEKRVLVPSDKSVATYNLAPQMKAAEIAQTVAEAIKSEEFDFIVLNFANPDMVGHTGDLKATIKAVEFTDQAMGVVSDAVEEAGAVLVVTADHGNAEVMVDEKTGERFTAHTTNPVPLIVSKKSYTLKENGGLADVAPTVLDIMGIEKPMEMSGDSLIER